MAKLSMWLTKNEIIALERTTFLHPSLGSQLNAVRGKTAGAYKGYSTFQWTPAVQSLVILALRHAARIDSASCPPAVLSGYEGSPASSLDYSIGKTPVWMLDIFGVDKNGTSVAKRLFHRTNPERKRSGPVAIAINEHMLAPQDIEIYVNDNRLCDPVSMQSIAYEIEAAFHSARKPAPLSRPTEKNRRISAQAQSPQSGHDVQSGTAALLRCPCCGEALTVMSKRAIAA